MILREYQEECVGCVIIKLEIENNTLVIAPTGAGKTIILSALIERFIGFGDSLFQKRVIILQHRLELVKQNSEKFLRVAPDFLLRTSILTGQEKDATGSVVFATVQTLSTESGLKSVDRIDYLVIDEAHHSAADTYTETIAHYRAINPDLKVIGLTATADRADGKGLGDTFTNVAYKIETDMLIEMGYLVPPDSYVMDIGIKDEIDGLDKKMSEKKFNQALAGLYEPVQYRVEEEWKRMAPKKHTICFCTTIDEAVAMAELFKDKGHSAGVVHSKLHKKENRLAIDQFHCGELQILFNVGILTEGFDCPTVNCVMLMRSCSAKSTMIQMVGRGLRPIVEEKDRWMEKMDCMVLDFGDSLRTHGTLRSDVNLEEVQAARKTSTVIQLMCPECHKLILVEEHDEFCPKCGERIFEAIEDAADKTARGAEGTGRIPLKNFTMEPFDLTKNSPFAWMNMTKIFPNIGTPIMVAAGMDHFVAIQEIEGGGWVAIGMPEKGPAVLLGIGRESMAFAYCNNYMSMHENVSGSKKSSSWHGQAPSDKQYKLIANLGWNPQQGDEYPENRYEAACIISFVFNKKKYMGVLDAVMEGRSKVNDEH